MPRAPKPAVIPSLRRTVLIGAATLSVTTTLTAWTVRKTLLFGADLLVRAADNTAALAAVIDAVTTTDNNAAND